MRIVAGRFRGARLAAPAGGAIRPTSDRVREAIFNIIAHGAPGFGLAEARVLDLFSGTGALGLEAISRGAAFCLFIEDDAGARGLIRRNIEALGVTGQTKILRRDATRLGPAGKLQPFDLLFADPPYGRELAGLALAAAAEGGWLAPGALCIIEERAGAALALPAGVTPLDSRVYGDTAVSFMQFRRAANT